MKRLDYIISSDMIGAPAVRILPSGYGAIQLLANILLVFVDRVQGDASCLV
jgi:hypothetical protein